MISELVRPIKSEQEFKSFTGMSESMFEFFVLRMYTEEIYDSETLKDSLKEYFQIKFKKFGKESTNFNEEFINHIGSLMQINDLKPGDLIKIDHYGKTSDGRIVLLDYGFNSEVYKMYHPDVSSTASTNQP